MNKILSVVVLVSVLALTGCGAFQNNVGKALEGLSTGNYTVTVWSGGEAVRTYSIVDGYVNSESDSDGWYFFVKGKMVRASGTVTIEQQ